MLSALRNPYCTDWCVRGSETLRDALPTCALALGEAHDVIRRLQNADCSPPGHHQIWASVMPLARRALVAFILTTIVALSPSQPLNAKPAHSAVATSLSLFDSEAAAQRHCPRDEVVWLNLPSGIYHEKGMRWYGRTKRGAYVCRKEADAAGDRDTRNSQ